MARRAMRAVQTQLQPTIYLTICIERQLHAAVGFRIPAGTAEYPTILVLHFD